MIPEAAWALVPEFLPEDVEPWEVIAVGETGLNQRQAFAYFWAHSILRTARSNQLFTNLESYLAANGNARVADVTAGFIPFGNGKHFSGQRENLYHHLPKNADQFPGPIWAHDGEDRWTFGLVIGVDYPSGEPPFTEVPTLGPVIISPFGTGSRRAFLVIVERREVLNDKPSNPSGSATSACYVRTRAGKRYYSGSKYTDGILVARHVLVPSYTAAGASVPMATTPPSSATVADIDTATTIDAAVLDEGRSMPSAAKALSLVAAVAPGLRVTVDGAMTNFSADVLRVMDDAKYFGNMVSHRAFIDSHGQRGDSGALTTDATGNAVGLYIGRTSAPIEGLVQLMRQVTAYFEIDLYL